VQAGNCFRKSSNARFSSGSSCGHWLLLLIHLFKNERPADQTFERRASEYSDLAELAGAQGGKTHLLIYIALQQYRSIDDGDHPIQYDGLV